MGVCLFCAGFYARAFAMPQVRVCTNIAGVHEHCVGQKDRVLPHRIRSGSVMATPLTISAHIRSAARASSAALSLRVRVRVRVRGDRTGGQAGGRGRGERGRGRDWGAAEINTSYQSLKSSKVFALISVPGTLHTVRISREANALVSKQMKEHGPC